MIAAAGEFLDAHLAADRRVEETSRLNAELERKVLDAQLEQRLSDARQEPGSDSHKLPGPDDPANGTSPFEFNDPGLDQLTRPHDPTPVPSHPSASLPASAASTGRGAPPGPNGIGTPGTPIPFAGPEETIQVESCDSFGESIPYQQQVAAAMAEGKDLPPEPKPRLVTVRKSDMWKSANRDHLQYAAGCPGCAALAAFTGRDWAAQLARSVSDPNAQQIWLTVSRWYQEFISAAHYSEPTEFGPLKKLYSDQTKAGVSPCILSKMFAPGSPTSPIQKQNGRPDRSPSPGSGKGTQESDKEASSEEKKRAPFQLDQQAIEEARNWLESRHPELRHDFQYEIPPASTEDYGWTDFATHRIYLDQGNIDSMVQLVETMAHESMHVTTQGSDWAAELGHDDGQHWDIHAAAAAIGTEYAKESGKSLPWGIEGKSGTLWEMPEGIKFPGWKVKSPK